MCGIAGFYSPKWSRETLIAMTEALAHRGPDAQGIWFQAPVGLGHRRLSILDLSPAANQPMTSADGRFIIVFNGEIYNYREIAADLQKKYPDIRFKTHSDTEVLLEACAREGMKALDRCNGMFAFALFDRHSQHLFVARDRIGVKPVVYHFENQHFAFASETKALLTLNLSRQLNLTALQDYLFLEYIPAPLSIFEAFRRLEAGHYLVFDGKQLQKVCYYNLLTKIHPRTERKHCTPAEAEAIFTTHFNRSIALRQIADVPIGAFLSGGTDSSLVCAFFQQQQTLPIRAYTIGFDVPGFNEAPYAIQVAAALGCTHQVLTQQAEQGLALIEQLPQFYDEPFAVSSMLPSLLVCQTARTEVTVALSGDGGDELFMGYGYYRWQQRIQRLNRYGGTIGRKLVAALLGLTGRKKGARIIDYPEAQAAWLHIRSQEQECFTEKEISQLLGKNYRHTTLLDDWLAICALDLHPFEHISLFDLRHYLADNLLYKMDIASMAYALEVRLPFLDYQFVEAMLNLPLTEKISTQDQKILPKRILNQFLPKELVYRRKWGFPAPLFKWLRHEKANLITRYLNTHILKKQGIFNPAFVKPIIEQLQRGIPSIHKQVWALLYFQLWYCHYIDPNLS
jgi:asparagine synthase (glutamine-hydrolysing)